jgi:hypothetical protein
MSITIQDIQKALDQIRTDHSDETIQKRIFYNWGWIKCGEDGLPIEIGLNKEMYENVKEFVNAINYKKFEGEIVTVYGVPVFKSKLVESRL